MPLVTTPLKVLRSIAMPVESKKITMTVQKSISNDGKKGNGPVNLKNNKSFIKTSVSEKKLLERKRSIKMEAKKSVSKKNVATKSEKNLVKKIKSIDNKIQEMKNSQSKKGLQNNINTINNSKSKTISGKNQASDSILPKLPLRKPSLNMNTKGESNRSKTDFNKNFQSVLRRSQTEAKLADSNANEKPGNIFKKSIDKSSAKTLRIETWSAAVDAPKPRFNLTKALALQEKSEKNEKTSISFKKLSLNNSSSVKNFGKISNSGKLQEKPANLVWKY